MNHSIMPGNDVLEFWAEAGPAKWWSKDDEFDALVSKRFGELHQQAVEGDLDHWENSSPDSALALIIILDQFSRNLFRGQATAFSADAKALAICNRCLDAKIDVAMRDDLRSFAYMPLMHSEHLDDQNRSVVICQQLGSEEGLAAAIEHRDIIARFGRFPHRNTVLNRESTADEIAFLKSGGFAG